MTLDVSAIVSGGVTGAAVAVVAITIRLFRKRKDLTPVASDPPHPRGSFFFTREGDMDLGWAILSFCVVVGMTAFLLEGFGVMKGLSTAGWTWFGSFTTASFGAATLVARARLANKADVSAAEARAIDEAVEDDPGAGAALLQPKLDPATEPAPAPAVVAMGEAALAALRDTGPKPPAEPDLRRDDESGS